MSAPATDPIDETHRDCLDAREQLNDAFARAKARAATWDLTDAPEDWDD